MPIPVHIVGRDLEGMYYPVGPKKETDRLETMGPESFMEALML